MIRRMLTYVATLGLVMLFAGCAMPKKQVDYAAFKAARPRSIVVLPPLNESADIKASYSMLSQATAPLLNRATTCCPWRWSTRRSARTA